MDTNDTPANVGSNDGLGLWPERNHASAQTPLLDLLRAVPADARLIYEHSTTESQSIPVGRHAADAVAEIERLRAELAEAVATIPQAVRNERERCAALCDAKADHCDAAENYYGANAARDLADAIREA